MMRLWLAIFLALSSLIASPANAQPWPAKPIRIVLQFPPGGSTPEELAAFVQEQLKAWERAFREAGMNPE